MRSVLLLASLSVLSMGGIVHACQLDTPEPHPSWEEKIALAETIFVGHVTAVEPIENAGGENRVVLSVDTKIRGDVGASLEALGGASDGGGCSIPFALGDRVIFAGDAIWSPTIFLSDPLTAEQERQMAYVATLPVERGEPQ
jgi:hypothetical protein